MELERKEVNEQIQPSLQLAQIKIPQTLSIMTRLRDFLVTWTFLGVTVNLPSVLNHPAPPACPHVASPAKTARSASARSILYPSLSK